MPHLDFKIYTIVDIELLLLKKLKNGYQNFRKNY